MALLFVRIPIAVIVHEIPAWLRFGCVWGRVEVGGNKGEEERRTGNVSDVVRCFA